MLSGQSISVILPVLNEAKTINLTLASIKDIPNVEIIVVDGGSQDNTVDIAKSLGVKVLSSPAGRGQQMNAGAKVATGDILLFLHADTHLPIGFDTLIYQALENQKVVAGAFELKIDGNLKGLRLIEKMVSWRSRFFSLPYGDQAIFLKSSIFQDIGGFPDIPIMEDFEFIRSLKRLGKIAILPTPVITSARRWQKLGVIKTTIINQLVIFAFFLGISPSKIAQLYRQGWLFPK